MSSNSIRIDVLDDKSFLVRVEFTMPVKQKNEKGNNSKVTSVPENRYFSKEFSAKNIEEVSSLLEKYLPKLAEVEAADKNSFEKAFAEAAAKIDAEGD